MRQARALRPLDSSVDRSLESRRLKRATYYMRPEQIKALKLQAVLGERNLSELVREAVDAYLRRPKKSAEKTRAAAPEDDILFCG